MILSCLLVYLNYVADEPWVCRDVLVYGSCTDWSFGYLQIIGVVLAYRFRNMKDPRANPNAFL